MTEAMIDIAKEKDVDGTYAKMGMRWLIAHHFKIDFNSEAVIYILETFLECISSQDLLRWLRTPNEESPMVLTRETLEKDYSDLLEPSTDLESVQDLFCYLYDQEFWIDKAEDCLYSTTYRYEDRVKLNYIGIAMEYERLCTLYEHNIVTWKDVDSMLEVIQHYGLDIEARYDVRVENNVEQTTSNIIDRLNYIFSFN